MHKSVYKTTDLTINAVHEWSAGDGPRVNGDLCLCDQIQLPRPAPDRIAPSAADHTRGGVGDEKDRSGKGGAREGTSARLGKGARKTALDICVDDPTADKERVIEHLRSIPPSACEPFLQKYIERVTETAEFRNVKKRFDRANSVRQKFLSGSIKSLSNAQREMISELSGLRRMLTVLKQRKLKEQQRLQHFFLPYLEETNKKTCEGQNRKSCSTSSAVVNIKNDPEEAKVSSCDRTKIVAATFAIKSPTSVAAVKGCSFSLNTDSSEQTGKSHGKTIPFSSSQELETDRVRFSPDCSCHGRGAVSTCCCSSREINQKSAVFDGGSSAREATSVQCVGCVEAKTCRKSVFFETDASLRKVKQQSEKQEEHNEQKEGGKKRRKKKKRKSKKNGSVCKDIDLIENDGNHFFACEEKKKTFQEVKNKKPQNCAVIHVVDDLLEYVRLQLPFSNCQVGNEKVEKTNGAKQRDVQKSAVFRRLERELEDILRRPVPRITVIDPQKGVVKDRAFHRTWDETSDKATVAEWNLYISPSDGPLAGQVVQVVVAFPLRYPFVPPFVYLTVSLPLAKLMVSDVGQANTVQLPWTFACPAVGSSWGTASTSSSTMWCPGHSVRRVFFYLQDFFGAEAFATVRSLLDKELCNRTVVEARVKCGMLAANLLTFTRATLELVNGPFIVFSRCENASLPKKKGKRRGGGKGFAAKKENGGSEEMPSEASSLKSLCCYADGVQSVIKGPFEGCWGHLLRTEVPIIDMNKAKRKRSGEERHGATQCNVSDPVVTVCISVPAGQPVPTLELAAITQDTVLREKPHWAELVLTNLHADERKNDGSICTMTMSPIRARLIVSLIATEANKENVVRFFLEEERGEKKSSDGLYLPRCVVGSGQQRETSVFLPTTDAFLFEKGAPTSFLSWVIILRVEEGCLASVRFFIPAAWCNVVDVKRDASLSFDVADVVTDEVAVTVKESACCGKTFAPLFCVASLDTETTATGVLGVMCDVTYSHCLSKSEFLLDDVAVALDLVLSESVFDSYFLPIFDQKKFFLASTFLAPITLFLPLVNPDRMSLPPPTLNRLKLTITQLYRSPNASTAYTPPFRDWQGLRFFALALRNIARRLISANSMAHGDENVGLLNTVFMRILCTFTLLVESEGWLQGLCDTIFLGRDSVELASGSSSSSSRARNAFADDGEELNLFKWLLISWCSIVLSNGLKAFGVFCATTTTNNSNNTNTSKATREKWNAVSEELMAFLKTREKVLFAQFKGYLKLFEFFL